jgi:hypothetical protein
VRLLSEALDGKVEITFEPTGLLCKMSAMLAKSTPSIIPDVKHDDGEVLASD